jgi:hypothetical protein
MGNVLAYHHGQMTGYSEVIPGQKSACGKSVFLERRFWITSVGPTTRSTGAPTHQRGGVMRDFVSCPSS